MPHIDAATVQEHRANREAAILDAAEQLLAGGEALTVAGVAERVGLARNSFYRYFDGVEELVEAVAARDFPRWESAVVTAMAMAATDAPEEAVVAYVRANLAEMAAGDHPWRVSLSRVALPVAARQRLAERHHSITRHLTGAVRDLGVDRPELVTATIQALVNAGVGRLAAGDDTAVVVAYLTDSTRAVLAVARGRERAAPKGGPLPKRFS